MLSKLNSFMIVFVLSYLNRLVHSQLEVLFPERFWVIKFWKEYPCSVGIDEVSLKVMRIYDNTLGPNNRGLFSGYFVTKRCNN